MTNFDESYEEPRFSESISGEYSEIEDDYDPCRYGDHQWQSAFNGECEECVLCGAIDC